MAYDSTRREIILLSGTDTWRWNGARWSFADGGFGAGSSTAMAHLPDLGLTVAYGGNDKLNHPISDTLTWDGTMWTQVAVANCPSGPPNLGDRASHAMVYDPSRRRVLLFGGIDSEGASAFLTDLWEFDGVRWCQIDDGFAAPKVEFPSLVFDPVNGYVVLAGRLSESGDTVAYARINDEWTNTPFVGTGFGVPSEFNATTIVWDTTGDRLLWPGSDLSDVAVGEDHIDTYSFGSGPWELYRGAPRSAVPTARIAYDPIRGVASSYDSEGLWQHSGGRWQQTITTGVAPSVTAVQPAFAPNPGATLFYGGSLDPHDAWLLTGNVWQEKTLSDPVPSARTGHSMATDWARGTVLLFGGQSGPAVSDELWSFAGDTWTRLESGPAGRVSASMAFDPTREHMVLFGGTTKPTENEDLGDTWTWNGTAWDQQAPGTSPSPRRDAAMFYDANRRRIVLHGGKNASGALRDTWEWNSQDETWVPVGISALSPRRAKHGGAYLATRSFTVAYGGANETTAPQREMILTYDELLGDERCDLNVDADDDGLVGCADPDCWGYCQPLCFPGAMTECYGSSPRCGDTECDALENWMNCPEDCTEPIVCGDAECEGLEDLDSCPGDCPT